ncbi:Kinesin (KAR3 subfamily) [Forsythia ovata]|uniref:Kinesin (KAR3 subfamily) n=1 Tax=Forsythia ovata TaxID=205694 RepID=A0ABD1X9F8_9LAMI
MVVCESLIEPRSNHLMQIMFKATYLLSHPMITLIDDKDEEDNLEFQMVMEKSSSMVVNTNRGSSNTHQYKNCGQEAVPCLNAYSATILEKQSIEVRLAKVSSQGLENNMRKELTEANNQVLHKTQDELKARSAEFHAVEESKGNLQVRKHLFKKELQGLKGRMLMR